MHRGLFQYTRLPFGVASAPALFQKVMDTVLQGLSKVTCYLDDILITGSSQQEHFDNLKQVLQRLEQYGIHARKFKCAFMCQAVEYLGHRVDAEGLHRLDTKVAAMQKAPNPRDVQELRPFLGLVHYYGKFLSTCLQSLNNLLKLILSRSGQMSVRNPLQKSRNYWHQRLFLLTITPSYQFIGLEMHLYMALGP